MTDNTELVAELRRRINPAYVMQEGTESYERKQCADAIEALEAEVEADNRNLEQLSDAVNALRKQLAAAQEPFDEGLINTWLELEAPESFKNVTAQDMLIALQCFYPAAVEQAQPELAKGECFKTGNVCAKCGHAEFIEQAQPERAPLTNAEIKAVLTKAVQNDHISWLGFELDAAGKYTVPALSDQHYQIVRAIEQAHGIKQGGAA